MGLVQKGGKVDVGLPLIGGEGVEDGALRLERLGGAVSLHGLRGKGDARGSGRTHKEKSRGEQARAGERASRRRRDEEGRENHRDGRSCTTSDGCREGAFDGPSSARRERAARRWAKATRGALLFLRTRSLKSPIFDPPCESIELGVHDLKALSC